MKMQHKNNINRTKVSVTQSGVQDFTKATLFLPLTIATFAQMTGMTLSMLKVLVWGLLIYQTIQLLILGCLSFLSLSQFFLTEVFLFSLSVTSCLILVFVIMSFL